LPYERRLSLARLDSHGHNPFVVSPSAQSNSRPAVVSLFSGPGGLDLGFKKAGFDTLLACDFSSVAVETFNQNLPRVAKHIDLASASPAEIVDLVRKTGRRPSGVIGGPPCQSFSQANVRQRKGDPRQKLVFRFREIVAAIDREFNIDFFLMENVARLAKPKYRNLLDTLKKEFGKSGFEVYETVTNAALFGVPQVRPRLFLVGIKRELANFASFTFPSATTVTPRTLRDAIAHLGAPVFFDRTGGNDKARSHPNHWTMMPKSAKFVTRGVVTGRSFRRLKWDEPSPTVAYGHREIHVHPSGTRRLSIFEAMLLQGFPASYELKGNLSEQVIQVSDAVPPPLARALAKSIRSALYDRRASVQAALKKYYDTSARSFPWRKAKSAFHLLVAEKLLQQTAARTSVTSAYRQLTTAWATPKELAKAPLLRVRTIVQPLGLTYRADELIAMAKTIVADHGGVLPRDRRELMALPGVGEYAADAVLSFARISDTAIVDTNVSRFLHRLLRLDKALPANPARDKNLKRLAEWVISGQPSRELNFAVLDLTALICGKQPMCAACPLRKQCATSRLSAPSRDTFARQDPLHSTAG
jgi:DNA (cytosine-5)-methyltransferase 1